MKHRSRKVKSTKKAPSSNDPSKTKSRRRKPNPSKFEDKISSKESLKNSSRNALENGLQISSRKREQIAKTKKSHQKKKETIPEYSSSDSESAKENFQKKRKSKKRKKHFSSSSEEESDKKTDSFSEEISENELFDTEKDQKKEKNGENRIKEAESSSESSLESSLEKDSDEIDDDMKASVSEEESEEGEIKENGQLESDVELEDDLKGNVEVEKEDSNDESDFLKNGETESILREENEIGNEIADLSKNDIENEDSKNTSSDSESDDNTDSESDSSTESEPIKSKKSSKKGKKNRRKSRKQKESESESESESEIDSCEFESSILKNVAMIARKKKLSKKCHSLIDQLSQLSQLQRKTGNIKRKKLLGKKAMKKNKSALKKTKKTKRFKKDLKSHREEVLKDKAKKANLKKKTKNSVKTEKIVEKQKKKSEKDQKDTPKKPQTPIAQLKSRKSRKPRKQDGPVKTLGKPIEETTETPTKKGDIFDFKIDTLCKPEPIDSGQNPEQNTLSQKSKFSDQISKENVLKTTKHLPKLTAKPIEKPVQKSPNKVSRWGQETVEEVIQNVPVKNEDSQKKKDAKLKRAVESRPQPVEDGTRSSVRGESAGQRPSRRIPSKPETRNSAYDSLTDSGVKTLKPVEEEKDVIEKNSDGENKSESYYSYYDESDSDSYLSVDPKDGKPKDGKPKEGKPKEGKPKDSNHSQKPVKIDQINPIQQIEPKVVHQNNLEVPKSQIKFSISQKSEKKVIPPSSLKRKTLNPLTKQSKSDKKSDKKTDKKSDKKTDQKNKAKKSSKKAKISKKEESKKDKKTKGSKRDKKEIVETKQNGEEKSMKKVDLFQGKDKADNPTDDSKKSSPKKSDFFGKIVQRSRSISLSYSDSYSGYSYSSRSRSRSRSRKASKSPKKKTAPKNKEDKELEKKFFDDNEMSSKDGRSWVESRTRSRSWLRDATSPSSSRRKPSKSKTSGYSYSDYGSSRSRSKSSKSKKSKKTKKTKKQSTKRSYSNRISERSASLAEEGEVQEMFTKRDIFSKEPTEESIMDYSNNKKNPTTLVVMNLPATLTETQIKAFFEGNFVGVLKGNGPHLKGISFNNSRSICILEFFTPEDTNTVQEKFHNVKYKNRILNIVRPKGYIPVMTHSVRSKAVVDFRVVLLKEMVTKKDLVQHEEYLELYKDIKKECLRYGSLLQLLIPRPEDELSQINGDLIGKVFLCYSTAFEANSASEALNGRRFSGRRILSCLLSNAQCRQMGVHYALKID